MKDAATVPAAALVRPLVADALASADEGPEGAARRLVGTLRANKFPLLACSDDLPPALAGTRAWREALARDQETLSSQRQEFLRVREAWARAGIPCLAFKSAGTFPSFPYTSDNLDLLVHPDDCPRARALLEGLGYVWLRNIDEPRKFLFRRFVAGRSVLAVHVHAWVGWDVEFLGQGIWRRARPAPDDPFLTVPGPEDCLLVNVAHALYENKRFTLFDLHKVTAHWAAPDLDWGYIEGEALNRGWHDGLLLGLLACVRMEEALTGRTTAPPALVSRWRRALRAYPWAYAYWLQLRRAKARTPFPISFPVSKLLYYRKVLSDGQRLPAARAADLLKVLVWGFKQKSGLRPQPGLLVSLSGLDGAGKSTVAKALHSALRISGVRARVVWTRCGCSPAYRALSGVARRLLDDDGGGEGHPPSTVPPLPALWAAANALDVLVSLAWHAWLPRLLGKVVVCDRYTYDAAAEILSRLGGGGPLATLALRLLLALAPRPDHAFLLDVPPEVASARGDEAAPPSVLAAQRDIYLRLAREHRLWVVDTSGEGRDPRDLVTLAVLRDYQDRFRTLLNGLLLSNPSQLNPDDPMARTPLRRWRCAYWW
ncbi:MAG TPA: nucleotidyltransferase family protein [Dehalococcoidia bacterium]|nr:nucleotidyltransferase family protein [Dehalococcoidia bacterium]